MPKKSKAGKFRILNERTELVPIDSVQPHERNVNEADLGAIIESEDTNGFYGSLIVQESTRKILAGTHRWRAAQHLGAKQIPVTFIQCSDEEALRIMLADNRTTRLGVDNQEGLVALLQEIQADTGSLVGTGFDGDALDELLNDLNMGQVPNFQPATQDEQGRLDQKKPITCPECGHEFTA